MVIDASEKSISMSKTSFPIACFFASVILAAGLGRSAEPTDHNAAITAIDILLNPDKTMVRQAEAANTKLRANNPDCFALDAYHIPHITVLQRYVRTDNLKQAFAAVDSIVTAEHPTNWKLKAIGFFSVPFDGKALTWLAVEPTEDLRDFQQKLIAAIAPFTVENGTGAAFVPRADGQSIIQPTVTFVNEYVAKYSGKNFSPHVTVGLGYEEFVKRLRAEPFAPFTFGLAGVSIYQLGEYGTAQQKLWPKADAFPSTGAAGR
jgi:2'-5' RNA ligase